MNSMNNIVMIVKKNWRHEYIRMSYKSNAMGTKLSVWQEMTE